MIYNIDELKKVLTKNKNLVNDIFIYLLQYQSKINQNETFISVASNVLSITNNFDNIDNKTNNDDTF
jgi:hypothetical protein